MDGRICLWDSMSHGEIQAPMSTLVEKLEYPIYAVDTHAGESVTRIAAAGGREAGFLGMPLYIYDVDCSKETGR